MTDSGLRAAQDAAPARSPRLSFEFFPPRTAEGRDGLAAVAERLGALDPAFFSCTYGAGGSTRDGTRETVRRLLELGYDAAPHLSIGADSEIEIGALLDEYRALGVRRIVALRGDLPSGLGRARFAHNAETLVRWIRAHSGDFFHLAVAAYPETHPDAANPTEDLDYFKRKVDAGANSAITQYFYHPHAYIDFVRRCEHAGLELPVVPGIMPITNYEGIVRFSEGCGADIPRWMRKHLEALRDDPEGLKTFATEAVTRLCEDLLAAGAPGLHFYTLNRWGATLAICTNLGFPSAAP
jgi:methylenetetrahydrofolate reductase (NADPH)